MWYNPIIKAVLRSPLHGLVSNAYVLVTFKGRKTGAVYSTPVQYRQEDERLTFVTRRKRLWWRNLQDGAPVELLLRGQVRKASAHAIIEPAETVAAEICRVYAPYFKLERAAKLASGSVIVYLDLE